MRWVVEERPAAIPVAIRLRVGQAEAPAFTEGQDYQIVTAFGNGK
jgi:hypothetical protein